LVNPRKAYPIDPGLIPVYDRSGRANTGHALETCVLLELQRRGADVAYVRTGSGREVDFLARYPGGQQTLLQVCADICEPGVQERETLALAEASREFPRATQQLVLLDVPPRFAVPQQIQVQAASAWLLEEGQ
jgi:hypothetical protein